MTFKEYLANLNKFAEEHPEALELDVIASIDDEGNGYNKVQYYPSVGRFEDGEFRGLDEDSDDDEEDTNAICIN